MHRSYEAGMLEDPEAIPPDDMFKLTRSLEDTPDRPSDLIIRYKNAMPVHLVCDDEGVDLSHPVELFSYLNYKGGEHGNRSR